MHNGELHLLGMPGPLCWQRWTSWVSDGGFEPCMGCVCVRLGEHHRNTTETKFLQWWAKVSRGIAGNGDAEPCINTAHTPHTRLSLCGVCAVLCYVGRCIVLCMGLAWAMWGRCWARYGRCTPPKWKLTQQTHMSVIEYFVEHITVITIYSMRFTKFI